MDLLLSIKYGIPTTRTRDTSASRITGFLKTENTETLFRYKSALTVKIFEKRFQSKEWFFNQEPKGLSLKGPRKGAALFLLGFFSSFFF